MKRVADERGIRHHPGDIKNRQDAFGCGMPSPRVIPHSDGAGEIDLAEESEAPRQRGRVVVLLS